LSDSVERVKISEFRVERAPLLLKIAGLGSCVALAVYDPILKIGGLAHILLPGPAPAAEKNVPPDRNVSKYADLAVPSLLSAMKNAGCFPRDLVAKIAGGSNMFQGPPGAEADFPAKAGIGERNVEAVKVQLTRLELPLSGQDIGGNAGRTLVFDLASGQLIITNLRGGKVVL
jgi:chemotaxis protein CheD